MDPADSPGRFELPGSAVAAVGYGTVSEVVVIAVARACATTAPLRRKFAIGSPKPEFVKPLPAIVDVAGGAARAMVLGVMPLTGAEPVSVTVRPVLPSTL